MNSTQPSAAQQNLEQLLTLFKSGRYAELEIQSRQLLESEQQNGMAWSLLGVSLAMQGKDALSAFQNAAQLMPDDPDAHSNLGNVLRDAGHLDDAMACYERALALNPGFAEAWYNAGVTLRDLGRLDEAVSRFRQALAIKPDYVDAHNNLGITLKDSGQFESALAGFQRALSLNPDNAQVHNNLGNVLRESGHPDKAIPCYRRALALNPDFPEAFLNLGISLRDTDRTEEAESSFRQALAIKPGYAEAHNNLGLVLRYQGRPKEALENYRRALALKPGYVEVQSNVLYALNYDASRTDVACLEEARRYGEMVSGKVGERYAAWTCDRKPERLRVGVVSGDLRNHPVGYALENLLDALDPSRVELYAYPTYNRVDELTQRIRPRFAAWRPLNGLSNEAAARLIHADGLHLLLDLAGHTAYNRLPVFAWKPAPVQASWLGYFATTGVAEMDYLLTSDVAVPAAHQAHFTEQIWHLPDIWLCFTAPATDLPVGPLPALENGHLTFGSFQRVDKVSDGVLEAWRRILAALPDARLRWQCKDAGDAAKLEALTRRLQRHGIDPGRVSLHGSTDTRRDYLACYHEVDIILDTFPYPGVTTTCEALWMGVPTVTLAGDTLLSRQGAGVVTPAGLPDWVAGSEADYVDKALAFAGDLDKLARLRATLRDQVLASPVFDAPRFARNFEAALWGMWQRWQTQHQAA
jgi:protein O-GlcNAc transferase